MYAHCFPPAAVKEPPAYNSLPETAKAFTILFIPEPSAIQLVPSHLAILARGVVPLAEKAPPTIKSAPENFNALTWPFNPVPRLVQLFPFHLAMTPAALRRP